MFGIKIFVKIACKSSEILIDYKLRFGIKIHFRTPLDEIFKIVTTRNILRNYRAISLK